MCDVINDQVTNSISGSERHASGWRQASSVVQDGLEHGDPVAPQHQVLRRSPILQHGSTTRRHPEGNVSFKQ